VRRENEVWELINRERKRRINERIEIENWKKNTSRYFTLLRRRSGGKSNNGRREELRGEGDKETELDRKEIREAIKKLKDGKAISGKGFQGKHGNTEKRL